jgi:hypothetical protein
VKISEAENSLPNGLHDAYLLRMRVDYEKRTAELDFTADYSNPNGTDEPDREVTLFVTGLHFISVPAPGPGGGADESAWVMGFEPLDDGYQVDDGVRAAASKLPAAAFCDATYVASWGDRCLVIAAEDARIEIKQ